MLSFPDYFSVIMYPPRSLRKSFPENETLESLKGFCDTKTLGKEGP